MPTHDIIVIGASAGGLKPLQQIMAGLPPDLPAAVFVVQHITPWANSALPQLLGRAGPLPAQHPKDGEAYRHGCVYVAPPDRHLLVKDGMVRLTRGPRENGTRPAVDPLFRSAAVAAGPRVIGVVLSGALDDGTAGLRAIQRCGGTTVVQTPTDAAWPSMPESALRHVSIDHCVPAADLGQLLSRLARERANAPFPVPRDIVIEALIAEQEIIDMADMNEKEKEFATPTTLSCPDCNGNLKIIKDGDLTRYRCRVGHAFTEENLAAAQAEAAERALWIALRTLDERRDLYQRMADGALDRGQHRVAERWARTAKEAAIHADTLRELLMKVVEDSDKPKDAEMVG